MSPTDRCDEVIRLIDGVLDEDDDASAGTAEAEPSANDAPPEVESVRGHWGVYYLRPSTA